MINSLPIKILYIVIVYLIGSINFSIILMKAYNKQDPRSYGSKNAGITNVYRKSGLKLASTILLMDIARSALIGITAKLFISNHHISLVCLSLILGNRFPCFHEFKGGKGVANYLGFTIVISPLTTLVGIALWLLTFLIFRMPFIASFSMILALYVGTTLTLESSWVGNIETLSILILIIVSHKTNIMQLEKK